MAYASPDLTRRVAETPVVRVNADDYDRMSARSAGMDGRPLSTFTHEPRENRSKKLRAFEGHTSRAGLMLEGGQRFGSTPRHLANSLGVW